MAAMAGVPGMPKHTKKLHVEVCNARGLMPKDGQGSSNPYVAVDFEGNRVKTKVRTKDLNPTWNERFDFNVMDPGNPNLYVDVNVFNERKVNRRSGFLGRVRVPITDIPPRGRETMQYYRLEKRSLFSHIKGEIGLKMWIDDNMMPPPPPMGVAIDKKGPPIVAAAAPIIPPLASMPPVPIVAAPPPPVPIPVMAAPAPPPMVVPPPHMPTPKGDVLKPKAIPIPESVGAATPHVIAPVPETEFFVKDTNPVLGGVIGEFRQHQHAFDLVEEMPFLFLRVVKARGLAAKDVNGKSDPYVRIAVGSLHARTKTIPKTLNPEWNQTFAFSKGNLHGGSLLLEVWDEDKLTKDDFIGMVNLNVSEIPRRVPPESSLAPQWYPLEDKKGDGKPKGDIMVSVWMGTQADEAFQEAWQSDTGGQSHFRSKVYMSPKLWYLRVTIIEAQDLQPREKGRFPEAVVKVHMGFQTYTTKPAINRSTHPFWNEELLFVAAEPFEDILHVLVEDFHGPKKEDLLGQVKIPIRTIESRPDGRLVASRWYVLDREHDKGVYSGRIHLRLCFDGGYHVMDESSNHSSCMRPTDKLLWRPSVGVLELGILGATGLLPMKTNMLHRASTDAYCVAKYGQKWVRTRTITDSFNPRWNEQYTWEVYDPCTVLTVGVFDNRHLHNNLLEKVEGQRDTIVGKVRIRLSTLESDRVYTNLYPLLLLTPQGVKKHGDLELAVRFSVVSVLNVMQIYTQPPLPRMHYFHPLDPIQMEHLRSSAMKMVATRLARSEPPLRPEVIQFMLDTESSMWSMRRSKANFYRIMSVLSSGIAVSKWFEDISLWRNSITTGVVHVLFLVLVWYPELLLPTIFLYMFFIGLWNYRRRPQAPPFMDAKLSQGDQLGDPDELEEEFNVLPSSKTSEVLRMRYDRLRDVSSRIQNHMGDLATQGERIQSLLSWRDPRATALFILFCLASAVLLYVTPFRVVAVILGMYSLRHPRFRDPLPSAPLNFFRRLPSQADSIL